jgi:hypothetical protein
MATLVASPRSRIAAWLVVLGSLPCLMGAQVDVDAGPATPGRLKAAFVYKFTLLVDWPEGAFEGPETPLSVCILGRDPFDGELEGALDGRESHGHPLEVRRIQQPGRARGCHVLYLASSEAERLAESLGAVAGAPILTVGETPDFAGRGGMIHLQEQGKRITLEINRAAARGAGIEISSRLFQVARAVHD